MKIYRKISVLILLCIAFSLLVSCKSKDVLELNSDVFTKLEAKEIDAQWLENRFIAYATDCYNGPTLSIYERDGKLYLEEYVEPPVHYIRTNRYSLIGYDEGEFAGFTLLVDQEIEYVDDEPVIKDKTTMINEKNCRGFLNRHVFYEKLGLYDTGPETYIVTGLPYLTDDGGEIYKFSDAEEEYKIELFAELDSVPMAFMWDGDNIIVATNKAICSVDPSGKVTELCQPDSMFYIRPNSMVKLNDSYYIGGASGILKYDLNDGNVTWYPYYNIEDK